MGDTLFIILLSIFIAACDVPVIRQCVRAWRQQQAFRLWWLVPCATGIALVAVFCIWAGVTMDAYGCSHEPDDLVGIGLALLGGGGAVGAFAANVRAHRPVCNKWLAGLVAVYIVGFFGHGWIQQPILWHYSLAELLMYSVIFWWRRAIPSFLEI